MFMSGAPGQVLALDTKTGLPIWRYRRQQKVVNPNASGNRVSRGVAGLGNRVFMGTLEAALVALDARTGRLLFPLRVNSATRHGTAKAGSITSARRYG